MIQYAPEGAWQDAQSSDPLASSYSGGSYHATSTQGATATFRFRGTGFTITGGRRPGYGPFSVTLDGQQLFNGSPPPESSPTKNALATVTGLSNDDHTVVFTNTGGIPVDLDTFVFQAQMGPAGSTPTVTTYDDNDSRISYLPTSSAWHLNSNQDFRDSTLHYSQEPDAAVSLQFKGNAIGVYGTVSPDHADLSISIDGKTATMSGGSGSHVLTVRPQVLVYWADDLADGQHTITISKAQNPDAGPFIDIDSFVVFSAAQSSSPSGNGSTIPPASTASQPEPVNRTAIIAGASVAGALALFLILGGTMYWWRRRRLHWQNMMKDSISPITPVLPMQGMMETGQVRRTPVSIGENPAFPFPPPTSMTKVGRIPVSIGGENPAFPFPQPTSVTKKSIFNKRMSKLSVAPSYYGDSDFTGSRAGRGSPDPLIPSVPRLAMPRTAASTRTVPDVVVTDVDSSNRPLRPNRRPPTLNIGSLQ